MPDDVSLNLTPTPLLTAGEGGEIGRPLPRSVRITYLLLFALSIVIINPFESLYHPDLTAGLDRLRIWILPKVAILGCIVVMNLLIVLRRLPSLYPGGFDRFWIRSTALWAAFIITGVISTIMSPMPSVSFQGLWGGGLSYYILLAAFVASHMLVLKADPGVLRFQGAGLIAGGVILALSVIPQIFDWRLDYTLSSGIVIQPDVLASTIVRIQTPIGLYNHRGHASFVLAAISLLIVMGSMRGMMPRRVAAVAYFLTGLSLFLCQTRGPQLALILAIAYAAFILRRDEQRRRHLVLFGGGILTAAYLSVQAFLLIPGLFTRDAIDTATPDAISSGRLHMWQISARAISERPVFGWGFNGFCMNFPRFADVAGADRGWFIDAIPVRRMIDAHRHLFSYEGTDSQIHMGILQSTKAHNIIVDTLIETGAAGMICCGALFLLFFIAAHRRAGTGSGVFALFYFIFLMTWYESAQYSHIAWWLMASAATGLLDRRGLPCE